MTNSKKELLTLSNSENKKVSSEDEALSEIHKAIEVIREFKPEKPEWFDGKNETHPLLTRDNDNIVPIEAYPMVGMMVGITGAVIGGVLGAVSALLPFVGLVSGLSIGAILGAVVTLGHFSTEIMAYYYGGSKTRQPIRKFLAKKYFTSHQISQIDSHVQDYQDYLVALKTHQMIINDARQELTRKGVFELLSSDKEIHSLSDAGYHEVDKVIEDDGSYHEATHKMIEHLKNKVKDRESSQTALDS